MSDLRSQINSLSAAEKAELLDTVWESLEADSASLTDAQRAELDYRIARHEQNPSDVIPWPRVRAGLFKKPWHSRSSGPQRRMRICWKRGRGMTTSVQSLASVSPWQSTPRSRQSRNIRCNSQSSTGSVDARECGVFRTAYSSSLRSIRLS